MKTIIVIIILFSVNCTTVQPRIVTDGKKQISENEIAIAELRKLPQNPAVINAIRELSESSNTIRHKEQNEIQQGIRADKFEQLANQNQTAANHWTTLLWTLGGIGITIALFLGMKYIV